MSDLPLLVDVRARRVVVVGAGRVAVRRVPLLQAAGAHVVVIAPVIAAELSDAGRDDAVIDDAVFDADRLGPSDSALSGDASYIGSLRLVRRSFRPTDLDGAWLVLACTNDAVTNAAVSAAATARQIFCVRSDAAVEGSARM
ncbi:MAG: hypothetical protein JO147_08990, partial [Actinobacteria bacterium]|nr:hypothetical protein [Actinomycetota bacterium]